MFLSAVTCATTDRRSNWNRAYGFNATPTGCSTREARISHTFASAVCATGQEVVASDLQASPLFIHRIFQERRVSSCCQPLRVLMEVYYLLVNKCVNTNRYLFGKIVTCCMVRERKERGEALTAFGETTQVLLYKRGKRRIC